MRENRDQKNSEYQHFSSSESWHFKSSSEDKEQRAVVKFEFHPSISLIKSETTNGNNFKFEPVSWSDNELEIRLLNPKKATTHKIFLQKY